MENNQKRTAHLSPIQEEVAAILKSERAKRGMSYKEFGELLGCSNTALRYWELGIREIRDIALIDKMFKELGITLKIGAKTEKN